jgi:hypothetical protein
LNEDANNLPTEQEEWIDDMKPLESRESTPTLEIDLDQQKVEVVDKKAQVEEEGARYWKTKFEEAKAINDRLGQYDNIIGHLEQSPDLVDILQKHIAGEVVDQTGGMFFDDDDDGYDEFGEPKQPEATKEPVAPQEDPEQLLRKRIEAEERAKVEMEAFMRNLLETGVPDHVVDEFSQFIANPNGMTIADVYAAYNNLKSRAKPEETQAPKEDKDDSKPSAPPIASMSGSTDRPESDLYKPTMDGHNYIPDANALM